MELYLILYNWKYNKTWKRIFDCEFDMDKFIRKIKYVPDVTIIEDSRKYIFLIIINSTIF